jgi:hypothetical protein
MAGCLAEAPPRLVATELAHRRPVGPRRRQRRCEAIEVAAGVLRHAAEQRQRRADVADLVFGHCEVVGRQHRQVGELPDRDPPLHAPFVRDPGVGLGPQAQRSLAAQPVGLWVEAEATDGLAGHQPRQRHPRVDRRDTGGVGAGKVRARMPLQRVDGVGKLHRVADEQDRRVVAHPVPVALLGIELDGEAAHVALGVGGTEFTGDIREARRDLSAAALIAEHAPMRSARCRS